jgi:hypothetical protein
LIIQVLESGKYKTITQLAKNEPTIYLNVKDNDELSNKYFPNRKVFEKHTEEDIKNIAKQCKNRNDMEIRFRGAMHKARAKYPHILDEVFGQQYATKRKHSEQNFIKIAKNYTRRYDMEKEHKGLFGAARQRFPHIIEKCFPKKNPSK